MNGSKVSRFMTALTELLDADGPAERAFLTATAQIAQSTTATKAIAATAATPSRC
jgi:hypothetical protein